MNDTQPDDAGTVEPNPTDLTSRLEETDPADAPPIAEELAERLGEDLDAASTGPRPDEEGNG